MTINPAAHHTFNGSVFHDEPITAFPLRNAEPGAATGAPPAEAPVASPPGDSTGSLGRLAPVLIRGKAILNRETLELLARPVPPPVIPKPWLEAKAAVGDSAEGVRKGLSDRWHAHKPLQTFRSGLLGALKSLEVVKEHSGSRDRRWLADAMEHCSSDPGSGSPTAQKLLNGWRVALLLAVFYASISNGAKLVLLSKHRLFNTPGSALLLSAIFSIAPVILYEWAAHQFSPRNRRRLDRCLQALALPCVLAGLGLFAWSFGTTAQNPMLAMASGVVPTGPNWGLVIFSNLVVEMFAEIGLWSGLRGALGSSARHGDKAGQHEREFKTTEVQVAELAALDARLKELWNVQQREEEAWIETGMVHFSAKRAVVLANEALAKAQAQAALAETAIEIE